MRVPRTRPRAARRSGNEEDGELQITLTSKKAIVGRVRCSIFTASKVSRALNQVLRATWRSEEP
jgi:hypothetical protein